MSSDEADFELKLIDKVTGNSKKISGSLEVIQKALGATGDKAEGSGHVMEHAWGEAVGSAIEKTVEKVLELGKEVGATVIEFANFAQKSEYAFGQLAKFGASPQLLFKHTQDMAVELGMDVETTTEKFLEFTKLQMNPNQSDDLIKMGADLRSLGTSSEEVNSVFTNMGQIFSKGKLGGDDLRSLEQAGISGKLIFAQLGKQLGKTSDEIQNLIQGGKIDAETAMTAIQDAVMHKTGEKVLGEAGKKFADTTMEGMVGRMKAQGERLMTQIGSQLAPALTSALQPIADDMTAFFNGDQGKQFVGSLVEGLTELAGVVKGAWPFVKAFVGGLVDGFQAAWPAIQGALGALFTGFGSGATWMDTVREFAVILGKVIAFGVGVAAVFGGEVAAGIQIAVALAGELSNGFSWVVNGIGAAIFAVDDFLANMSAKWAAFDFGALAMDLINGLVNGITNGVGLVVQAASNLGSSMMTSIKQKLGIASPSKVFEGYGDMTGAGLVQGIDASQSDVASAAGGLGEAAKGPMVSSLSAPPANQNAGAAAGQGGGGSTRINVTVNVSGAGDPDAVAHRVDQTIVSSLTSCFEQLRTEVAA
jgi:tape measure domain-containing protein